MFLRKEHGGVVVDGRQVADTLQCVHCGRHWVPEPGSGKVRGFCRCCMGPTCGAQKCDACLPFEKRLDLYEAGKLGVL